MVEHKEASPERFGRKWFRFRQRIQTNLNFEQSEKPKDKRGNEHERAFPAILSILAAAAAVTLAITAFANA